MNMRQAKCHVHDCWGWAHKRCRCKFIRYCSESCARRDWGRHKPVCLRLRGLSCDAFEPIEKFSKKNIGSFAFQTYTMMITPFMHDMMVTHDLLKRTKLTDTEIQAMSERDKQKRVLILNIVSVARLQPQTSIPERQKLGDLMRIESLKCYQGWIKVTNQVFIERILEFLVEPLPTYSLDLKVR